MHICHVCYMHAYLVDNMHWDLSAIIYLKIVKWTLWTFKIRRLY